MIFIIIIYFSLLALCIPRPDRGGGGRGRGGRAFTKPRDPGMGQGGLVDLWLTKVGWWLRAGGQGWVGDGARGDGGRWPIDVGWREGPVGWWRMGLRSPEGKLGRAKPAYQCAQPRSVPTDHHG